MRGLFAHGPALRPRRLAPRRLLSAGLLAAALATVLHIYAPTPAATVSVIIARHDIAAGARLTSGDLSTVRRPAGDPTVGGPTPGVSGTPPPSTPPDTSRLVGRVAAAPLAAGTPLTPEDLLGPGLLTGAAPGTVALAVRLATPPTEIGIRRGDHVDVIAAVSGATLAADLPVLADPSATGAILLVAVDPSRAGRLVQAQARGELAVTQRP